MRFVIAILSIIPLSVSAAVYKCERPDGTMSYQVTPCSTKEKSIKTPILMFLLCLVSVLYWIKTEVFDAGVH